MTDVLGADRIVWVEGATEELVFPDILRRTEIEFDGSIRFAGVAATGDFSKRGSSKKAVVQLYKEATSAVAPLVQGSSFLLDRETLSDDAVEQISRQTDRQLMFLARRSLECYALNVKAIAAILASEVPGLTITAREVEDELRRLAPDRKYGAASKWKGDTSDPIWLKSVDAAKLLSDVFENLTDHRLTFQKTSHTPRLIAETAVSDLAEIVTSLRAALAAAGSGSIAKSSELLSQ